MKMGKLKDIQKELVNQYLVILIKSSSSNSDSKNISSSSPKYFRQSKKVFAKSPISTNTQPKERPRDNTALREILNKTLSENKILEQKPKNRK